MKFLFSFKGTDAAVSVRGKYTLEQLKWTGVRQGRAEQTGETRTARNGRQVPVVVYRELIPTRAGTFEIGEWCRLADEAAFCEEKTGLLKAIMTHAREHCAWLHTEKDIREYALECLSSGAYRYWKNFAKEAQ